MFRPFRELHGVPEALAALADVVPRVVDVEDVPLADLTGRTLAADVAAPADVPAFHRSAMDGYAVRHGDTATASPDSPVSLPVVSQAHAGDPRRRLEAGEAVQVATGAILPDGADAVVRAEDTRRDGDTVHVLAPAAPDHHVSLRGGDFRAGDLLLKRGRVLDAAGVALAASHGLPTLPCVRRPRVAILPSGTEVVEPGRPLAEGEVYNSNAHALAALVRRLGAVPHLTRPVADTRDAHREALDAAARDADLVVVTGGTSVGERDHLAPLVHEHGNVRVHGLRVRPGKPVLIGTWGDHATPLLGLPGYPASCLVTAELFLVPAVRRAAGAHTRELPPLRAAWGEDAGTRDDLTTVVPVRLQHGEVRSTYKESGTLTSVVDADGYVLLPEGTPSPRKGDPAEVRPWHWR